jgi:hypothetical protein
MTAPIHPYVGRMGAVFFRLTADASSGSKSVNADAEEPLDERTIGLQFGRRA